MPSRELPARIVDQPADDAARLTYADCHVATLLGTGKLRHLTELDLSHNNKLTDATARHLAQAELPHLISLRLAGVDLTVEGLRALRDSPLELARLDAESSGVAESERPELADLPGWRL